MIRPLIILTLIVFISGCSENNQKETLLSSSIPDQESWNSTIFMTREGKKRAVIRSGHLSNYESKAKDEKREFNKLISTLIRTNAPPIEKEEAIEELRGKYSDYFGEVDLRIASLKELSEIQKTANSKFKKIINTSILDEKVEADFYSTEERHMSNLKSEMAYVYGDTKKDSMLAIGNVVVVSDSGVTLFTDSLMWNSIDSLITTDDTVMFITENNDTLKGVGFQSNADLTHYKFYDASGVTDRTYE
ncbi:MAG: hypothetical protein QF712_03255 [Candidatus Marinimicrobia bacterium]|nr:hypothetical protein [Candidatus Neomarinimicrobiota bacterium]MDP6569018.1 hypothetical protein [Candidatus Neomarinimicrobiota bacterium]